MEVYNLGVCYRNKEGEWGPGLCGPEYGAVAEFCELGDVRVPQRARVAERQLASLEELCCLQPQLIVSTRIE
jgi:hypothetical protein